MKLHTSIFLCVSPSTFLLLLVSIITCTLQIAALRSSRPPVWSVSIALCLSRSLTCAACFPCLAARPSDFLAQEYWWKQVPWWTSLLAAFTWSSCFIKSLLQHVCLWLGSLFSSHLILIQLWEWCAPHFIKPGVSYVCPRKQECITLTVYGDTWSKFNLMYLDFNNIPPSHFPHWLHLNCSVFYFLRCLVGMFGRVFLMDIKVPFLFLIWTIDRHTCLLF